MNQFFYKRDDGTAVDMVQVLIGILAMVFILFINISLTNLANRRSNVELVAHEYIFRMETEGCLSNEARTQLIETLTDMGIQNVIIRANLYPVDYGERITLTIQGRLAVKTFNMAAYNFTLVEQKSDVPLTITKTSVSRYVR